jgi:hypothetical protein
MPKTAARNAARNGGSKRRPQRRSYRGVLEKEFVPMTERRFKMYYKVLRNQEGLLEKNRQPGDFDWNGFNADFDADYATELTMQYMVARLKKAHGLNSLEDVRTVYNKMNRQASERSQGKHFEISSKGNRKSADAYESYEDDYEEDYED